MRHFAVLQTYAHLSYRWSLLLNSKQNHHLYTQLINWTYINTYKISRMFWKKFLNFGILFLKSSAGLLGMGGGHVLRRKTGSFNMHESETVTVWKSTVPFQCNLTGSTGFHTIDCKQLNRFVCRISCPGSVITNTYKMFAESQAQVCYHRHTYSKCLQNHRPRSVITDTYKMSAESHAQVCYHRHMYTKCLQNPMPQSCYHRHI